MKPDRHDDRAARQHDARPETVEKKTDQRRRERPHDRAEHERPRRQAAAPVKLLNDRHQENGKGAARAKRHGDGQKRDADDHPRIVTLQRVAYGNFGSSYRQVVLSRTARPTANAWFDFTDSLFLRSTVWPQDAGECPAARLRCPGKSFAYRADYHHRRESRFDASRSPGKSQYARSLLNPRWVISGQPLKSIV